jgi:hypothetical protein
MAVKLELPQTRGNFILKGKVVGVKKDTFYKSIRTKTNKDMKTINFGVQVSPESIIYVTFNGMEQEFVYYSGKPEGASKDTKNVTVKVEWNKRNTFQRNGFKLIGVNVGLEKTHDEKGKEVNDKRVLHQFDAAEYVAEHLEDDMSVFIRGNIEYGHYNNQNGDVIRTVKFIPSQISRCQDVVFEANEKGEPFEPTANFTQNLVFQSIEKSEEEDSKFILSANIVNYNSIEMSDFVVADRKLAMNFRKNLKPFTRIETWGNLIAVRNTDTVDVDDDDEWGESNKMDRVFAPYRIERVITGASPKSIDEDTYCEANFEKALELLKKESEKEKEFTTATVKSGGEDWGSKLEEDDEDDSNEPW